MKKRKKRKGATVSRLSPSPSERNVERVQEEAQKQRADRVIKSFMKDFPDKSLFQLLPVIRRRCSDPAVAKTALARIERNQAKELSYEDRLFLDKFRAELESGSN